MIWKKGQYNRILRTIASKEGVSAEEVEMEMQAAIEDAFYRMDKGRAERSGRRFHKMMDHLR